MTQNSSESDIDADGIFESDVEGDEGTRTVPTTTWSPGSSPGRASEVDGMAMRKEMDVHVAKMRSFEDMESVAEDEKQEVLPSGFWDGEEQVVVRPNRTSVGVAF